MRAFSPYSFRRIPASEHHELSSTVTPASQNVGAAVVCRASRSVTLVNPSGTATGPQFRVPGCMVKRS